MQRKFAREISTSKNSTFKQFREWLDSNYSEGPSQAEWEAIAKEDEEYYRYRDIPNNDEAFSPSTNRPDDYGDASGEDQEIV